MRKGYSLNNYSYSLILQEMAQENFPIQLYVYISCRSGDKILTISGILPDEKKRRRIPLKKIYKN